MSYNPYQSHELRIPTRHREQVKSYTRSQTESYRRDEVDDRPFERYIDMWFLGLCLAANIGQRTGIDDPHKFHTGVVLTQDPYRIDVIELVAIADTGDPWVIEDSSRVITIANEYAAAGLSRLLSMLREGAEKPIWNLTSEIIEEFGVGERAA
jgi:hypothetical protein